MVISSEAKLFNIQHTSADFNQPVCVGACFFSVIRLSQLAYKNLLSFILLVLLMVKPGPGYITVIEVTLAVEVVHSCLKNVWQRSTTHQFFVLFGYLPFLLLFLVIS